jgi:small subunit ribosomal protein S21
VASVQPEGKQLKVEVRNNNIDAAIRRLKRKLADEGVFKELQERRAYEKPSDRKRRLKRAAIARHKRERLIPAE